VAEVDNSARGDRGQERRISWRAPRKREISAAVVEIGQFNAIGHRLRGALLYLGLEVGLGIPVQHELVRPSGEPALPTLDREIQCLRKLFPL
jgi:hypothetical protein